MSGSDRVAFVVANESNDVVRAGAVGLDQIPDQKLFAGERLILGVGAPNTHYVAEGDVVLAYTTEQRAARSVFPPPLGKVWSNAAMDWVYALNDPEPLREDLLVRLAIKRDELLEAGFAWSDRVVQSDMAVSQARLLGLFTTDLAGGIPTAGLDWKFANGWRLLYPGDGISIWNAFQAFMQGLFVAFKAHETAVKAETDIEVLRNYDVEAGWPV